MFFYLLVEFRLCSFMYIVHILDLRSLILSYFCLMETLNEPIYDCIYLIYFPFFLSVYLSSLKR